MKHILPAFLLIGISVEPEPYHRNNGEIGGHGIIYCNSIVPALDSATSKR